MSFNHTVPPFRDLSASRLDARKEHVLSEIERDQQRPRLRQPGWMRPGRRVAVLAVLVALVMVGTAVAATTNWLTTDWLTGSRAPEAVVHDFGTYAPQLGFDPEPGRAVLVAEDGEFSLYATTNKQGSYCLVASAPWKRPDKLPDGGTCIQPAQAAAPLIAGLVGAASDRSTNEQTFLIAGRADDPAARTIRFTDPAGNEITRTIGSSGFFIAAIHTPASACADGDWTTAFDTLGADSEQRSRSTITLATARGAGTSATCTFSGPHP